jgi:uncharacterized SAM-binding protein YcdF (DUF218 family)
MLFYASKLFWRLLGPSHVLVWCAILAAILLLLNRRRAGTAFALITALLIVGIGVVPSYYWLGQGLEYRFEQKEPSRVDGILVLGGGPRENALRLPAAYMMARRHPHARVVFSGGDGSLFDRDSDGEAQASRERLLALGLDPARLALETHSRNTLENLRFSKAMIRPHPGEIWLMVTSAYHMPRAMRAAKQANWNVLPWPVSFYTHRSGPTGWFEVPYNIEAFDTMLHERVGLWAYAFWPHGD